MPNFCGPVMAVTNTFPPDTIGEAIPSRRASDQRTLSLDEKTVGNGLLDVDRPDIPRFGRLRTCRDERGLSSRVLSIFFQVLELGRAAVVAPGRFLVDAAEMSGPARAAAPDEAGQVLGRVVVNSGFALGFA